MYQFGFLFGAIVTIVLLSQLVAFVFLRKMESPKKDIFSIAIAFIITTAFASYGLANNEGGPKFLEIAALYGAASAFLLLLQLTAFNLKNKKD